MSYDTLIVFSFPFLTAPFGNGRIDHLTDYLMILLNRYYKYWQNMWLSWPKILISEQTDLVWSTVRGGVNYKFMGQFNCAVTNRRIE